MASPIQELFPSLVKDFNTVFSNLKDKPGFIGVDVILKNDSVTPVIRIIIEGLTPARTNSFVNTYKELLRIKIENIEDKIIWEEIIKESKPKNNYPQADIKKSDFFRTIQSGISVGGENTGVGTLGLICHDTLTNQPCMLTAYHVGVEKSLYQPRHDEEEKSFKIGDFLRYDPTGDSAIYSFNITEAGSRRDFNGAAIMYDTKIIDTSISIERVEHPKLGEKLNKVGLVTNKTTAVVQGIGIYKHNRVGEKIWVEGFWLIPENPANPDDIEITFGGDSGAIWYNEKTNAGVGLQIAGDQKDTPPILEFAIAQHLSKIKEELKIEFL